MGFEEIAHEWISDVPTRVVHGSAVVSFGCWNEVLQTGGLQ